MIENVEGSLLSSPEFRGFCDRTIVALVRSRDPAARALRREFQIPYLNSWVVTLNPKGEWTASIMGDSLGKGCTEESAAQFPAMLVGHLERFLQRRESYESLRRDWQAHPGDSLVFGKLEEILGDAYRYQDLLDLSAEALAVRGEYGPGAEAFRLVRFRAAAHLPGLDFEKKMYNREVRELVAREGEAFLSDFPSSPHATKIVELLVFTVATPVFDLPAFSRDSMNRLETHAKSLRGANQAALTEWMELLRQKYEERIAYCRTEIAKARATSSKSMIGYFAFQLGDAKAVIDNLDPEDPMTLEAKKWSGLK